MASTFVAQYSDILLNEGSAMLLQFDISIFIYDRTRL